MSEVKDAARLRTMRTRGYDDGLVPRRAPRHPDDPAYMRSFRRGREALNPRQENPDADH